PLRRLGLHGPWPAGQGLRPRAPGLEPLSLPRSLLASRPRGRHGRDPAAHLPGPAPARRHRDPDPGGGPRVDARGPAPRAAVGRCPVLLPPLRARTTTIAAALAPRADLPAPPRPLDGGRGGGHRPPPPVLGRAVRHRA